MVNKEILKLAFPNILSNLSVPLISTVDTILMGQLTNEHLGAVGIGAMIFNFLFWNFGFLRMGTTGQTAQAYGKGHKQEQIHILIRAALVSLGLTLLVFCLSKPIEWFGFDYMNVQTDQYAMVKEYFYIRLLAAPATLLLYVLNGWFFGLQNAIYPLYITWVVNLANIVVSWILVKEYGLEVSGVAWGTVIAQYSGLLLATYFLFRRYSDLFTTINRYILFQKESFLEFFKLNSNIFLRTICLTLAFSFFYSQSSTQGTIVLAVNVILIQLLNWMSYGVDGFAYASESLVGKYFGAKNSPKVYQSIKYSFIWGAVIAVLFSVAYGLQLENILGLFTSDQEVISVGLENQFWIFIAPILAFACYIWDGVYIGMTATKSMRNLMFISFVIYIASYYLLAEVAGASAIWLALLIFLLVRGILQTVLFLKHRLNLK